ncbi:universal stress protein [Enterococcus gilvus]|uniref:universal stress protein n=1 Tax=Enterococcus gilvus TaxID=160453 RepID=UPI003D6AE20D
MENKILVLMENTGSPKRALEKGEQLAKNDSSELHVLIFDTSQKEIFELEEEQNYVFAGNIGGEEVAREENELEDVENRDNEKTKRFISDIKESSPSNVIISSVDYSIKKDVVEYANEHNISLIILGQDESMYSRRGFDSLIKHVVNKTNSELLIVR